MPKIPKSSRKSLHSTNQSIQTYDVKTVSRDYRSSFSQAYKVLYKEGELSYLTEILDSAQEGKHSIMKVFPISGSTAKNIPFLKKYWTTEENLC